MRIRMRLRTGVPLCNILSLFYKWFQGKYPAIHIQTPQIQALIVFISSSDLKTRRFLLEVVPLPWYKSHSMTFNTAALFNHILSIIPLPDALVRGHPTDFGRSNTSLFIWAGRRIKRYSFWTERPSTTLPGLLLTLGYRQQECRRSSLLILVGLSFRSLIWVCL